MFPARKKGSSYIQSVPLFDLKDSTKLTPDQLIHLVVVNETPLFPSNADFNHISSSLGKVQVLASYVATGGGGLVNAIGARLQVNKMVLQKNLREIFPVGKAPKNPPQIAH